MDTRDVIAIVALVITLLVQSSALFYWGGGLRQMLRDHERRISRIEDSR